VPHSKQTYRSKYPLHDSQKNNHSHGLRLGLLPGSKLINIRQKSTDNRVHVGDRMAEDNPEASTYFLEVGDSAAQNTTPLVSATDTQIDQIIVSIHTPLCLTTGNPPVPDRGAKTLISCIRPGGGLLDTRSNNLPALGRVGVVYSGVGGSKYHCFGHGHGCWNLENVSSETNEIEVFFEKNVPKITKSLTPTNLISDRGNGRWTNRPLHNFVAKSVAKSWDKEKTVNTKCDLHGSFGQLVTVESWSHKDVLVHPIS
jgi:hypothetical protein